MIMCKLTASCKTFKRKSTITAATLSFYEQNRDRCIQTTCNMTHEVNPTVAVLANSQNADTLTDSVVVSFGKTFNPLQMSVFVGFWQAELLGVCTVACSFHPPVRIMLSINIEFNVKHFLKVAI